MRLRRLQEGARVIGGTVLGRVGRSGAAAAAKLSFSIRPAGKGAPKIDPKPILDGWKLLEATAIYRASGRNVLYGKGDSVSIGQVLLMPKRLLERRVLSDERIELYACGRDDVKSGQIDRRVLATLEYLAESGLSPTVTSLKCGHGFYTSSGNVSEHSSGSAVDIAKVNGIPILGHQEAGGITEQTVRRLMRLQGTMQPHQVISLLELGGPTMAMGDHADHIHVGFRAKSTRVFKPGQWTSLLDRLRQIENPVVPVKPSQFALPVKRTRGEARRGAGPAGIGLAARQELHAEALRQPLPAPAHDHVVVVLEHRPCDRGEQVHPPLGGGHLPVVDHRGHPGVLEQAPDAPAAQLTHRAAAHREGPLDPLDGELELERVGQAAAPLDGEAGPQSARAARVELVHAHHAAPPLGPACGVLDHVPRALARGVHEPGTEEAVLGYARPAISVEAQAAAGTPRASSTGVWGRPTPSATAGWVTWPAATFTPERSPDSLAIAPSTPWSASSST